MNEENATLCKKVFFQDFLGEKLIREGGFGGGEQVFTWKIFMLLVQEAVQLVVNVIRLGETELSVMVDPLFALLIQRKSIEMFVTLELAPLHFLNKKF